MRSIHSIFSQSISYTLCFISPTLTQATPTRYVCWCKYHRVVHSLYTQQWKKTTTTNIKIQIQYSHIY